MTTDSTQTDFDRYVTDGGTKVAAADPSVFEDTERRDIEITESQLLGTHSYDDVLYTGETEIVDVTTGETPDRLDKTVEQATQFAKRQGPHYVAKDRHPEGQAERGSPYSACGFFHFSITGNMQWHTVFRKAYSESDAYDVSFDANYESGDLTITVERA
jgi:hypothetical protein